MSRLDKSGIGNAAPDNTAVPDMNPMVFNPEYNTRLLLVRHGESLGNAVRRFLGHTNLGLSDRGLAQAERTGEFLRELHVDRIYSSDLLRAHETAMPHGRLHDMDIVLDEELREMHVGDWEGLYVADIIERYGEYFTSEWTEGFGTFRGAPGGESTEQLRQRIYGALMRIAKENTGKTVLVVFHAAAIRAAFGKILGISPENLVKELPFPTNASVSVVYFDGERLVPGEYSHDAHLVDL